MVARRGLSLVQTKEGARRACQKAMMPSIRVVFALTSQTKVQARTFPKTKAEERIKKEKLKKEPIHNPDSQPLKLQEGCGQSWESDDWSASHWTDDSWTPDAGWFCTKSDTARMVATPWNLVNHPTHVVLDLGFTRSIFRVRQLRKQKPARKVALFTFQQHHHVLPRLMCLRQVMCPCCFLSLR